MSVGYESGWTGVFTRAQAPGAIPNGTRIAKVTHDPGDTHQVGAEGTVLGSLSHPDVYDGMIGYFVEWDDAPRVAVGVIAPKIARLVDSSE